MTTSVAEALDEALEAMLPGAELSVSDWADEFRVLTSEASSEPGRWRTSRTPYLREIMDCLSPSSPIERVVLMKGAQIGATEAGNNWIGYVIHHAPGPMLGVQPTVETGKRWSKQRLAKLIENSPALQEKVKEARSRDSGNTMQVKEFPGGVLVITGANSAVGLRQLPVRYLFLDDVDGYPPDADGEGDPVDLAVKRTSTFFNRKIFMVSTPTLKDFSRIEAAYVESDQRRFWVPCPFCEEFQVLEWKQIRWPEGHPLEAAYVCAHCDARILDYQKTWMLERGEWRPSATGHPRVAGFHLSQLYSPHGWASWPEAADEFVRVHKDPVRLKVFVNTVLGETWEDRDGEAVDSEGLMDRREVYGSPVPEGVGIRTAAVDVQDDRVEVEVVGWGRDEECWSIDYRKIYGDPSGPAIWRDLDDYLLRTWDGFFRIEATAMDTGGHHTLAAYAFCRGKDGRRVWAIKGKAGSLPIWPRRPSRNNKGRVNLFTVGVDTAKEAIYSRLRGVKEPGPGYCHFPIDRDVDYFEQLTAEKKRVRYVKGFPMNYWWKPDGRRNEALDLRVYAYAALHGLISMGFELNKRVADAAVRRSEKDERPKQQPRPVVRSPYLDR